MGGPAMSSQQQINDRIDDANTHPKSKLNLLVIATGPRDTSWAQALVVRLSKNSRIETRAIVDDVVPRLSQTVIVMQNRSLAIGQTNRHDDSEDAEYCRQQAVELTQWADILACVPLDADGIAKMLVGIADRLVGEVLRGWNSCKPIFLAPGMSDPMWKNPMTRRQLEEMRSKWNWIGLMPPITWTYEGAPTPRRVTNWDGFNDVLEAIQHHADLLGLGSEEIIQTETGVTTKELVPVRTELPSEIWSTILDFTGDWELAKALGVYTTLPVPPFWAQLRTSHQDTELKIYESELLWTVLTSSETATCRKLSQAPLAFHKVPNHFMKIALRFALNDVLKYISTNRPDLYQDVAQQTFTWLTRMKSTPNVAVLDFWIESGWAELDEDETCEKFDSFIAAASRRGFINVLEWWHRRSHKDLPLVNSKDALEQASLAGQIKSLQWWRRAAALDERIVLSPGQSLLLAAKGGHMDVLKWWETSGIAVGYRDIITLASSVED